MRARLSIPMLALIAALAPSRPAFGQAGGGFDLSWHALAGGGAVASQGGSFTLGGTAGQAGCRGSAGGAFALTGGFWNGASLALTAVQGLVAGPHVFALRPARPNPLADRSTLEFDLPGPRAVRLEILDVAGQRVRTLVDAPLTPGIQRVAWDGCDASGAPVANGIYFAHLSAGEFHASARIAVLH